MNESKIFSRLIENPDSVSYALRALNRLSAAWTSSSSNQSQLRATFRRWRPDTSGKPSYEMQRYIWGWIGSPFTSGIERPEQESDEQRNARRWREREEEELVNRTAIIVAMRAATSDHASRHPLGTALQKAGMADMRLMRLLTERHDRRLLSLHRAMQLLDAKGLGVDWTTREVRNVLDFLFGSDSSAQRAANNWAADFFRARGKTAQGGEGDGDGAKESQEAAVAE